MLASQERPLENPEVEICIELDVYFTRPEVAEGIPGSRSNSQRRYQKALDG